MEHLCCICGEDYEPSLEELMDYKEGDEFVCEDCVESIVEYFEIFKVTKN